MSPQLEVQTTSLLSMRHLTPSEKSVQLIQANLALQVPPCSVTALSSNSNVDIICPIILQEPSPDSLTSLPNSNRPQDSSSSILPSNRTLFPALLHLQRHAQVSRIHRIHSHPAFPPRWPSFRFCKHVERCFSQVCMDVLSVLVLGLWVSFEHAFAGGDVDDVCTGFGG